MEGNYLKVLSWHFPGNRQLRWPQTEIQTVCLQSTRLKCYRFTSILSNIWMWMLQSIEVDSVTRDVKKYLHTGIIQSIQMKIHTKFEMKLDNTLNLVTCNMFVVIMRTANYWWHLRITDLSVLQWDCLIQSFLCLDGMCVHVNSCKLKRHKLRANFP